MQSIRVVDLSADERAFASYLLAHVSADVVAIEPPGGVAARRTPSMFEAYWRGKSSQVIDHATPSSIAELESWIAGADVVIDPYTPAEGQALGVTPARVAELNPTAVHVSITPFGATGPKTEWPATDLTIWASSGAHALAGDRDRAPVRTSVPQAYLHAAADAAGAVLIGLYERDRSGVGQHIDVSAQASSAQAALSGIIARANGSTLQIERVAGGLQGAMPIRLTWPCRDGYVAITFLFGPAFTDPNQRLMQWLFDEGAISADEAAVDWGDALAGMMSQGASPEPYYTICEKIEVFTRTRSQSELFEEGLRRGIYIAPTLDIAGVLTEAHFRARNYWHALTIDGQSVDVPGPFAKLSATPIRPPGPAPAVGSETRRPVAAPAPSPRDHVNHGRPLAGLKVLDFMWVIAGPFFTRVLADYGADVIKVESSTRLEPARGAPTFKDDAPGVETGIPFQNFNAGKRSITVDPSNPAGREVLLDLVRWADVVTESFSPKAMKDWGLDFEALKAVNPDIVMISSCLMGQTGPRAQVPGYGNMAAAIAGFYDLTGWPDRSPAGPYLAYTDGVAPRFMLVALMAALRHRRQTGEGQHIDLSQAEAALHFLAPAIVDYGQSGHVAHRLGNRDLTMCPHGVYATEGDDAWIAIAVDSEGAWQALAELVGLDAGLDLAARQASEADIERAISAFTGQHEAFTLTQVLIERGIAAHPVQNSLACLRDDQLEARKHFIAVPHESLGDIVVENTRARMNRTPGQPTRAAPELGQHSVEILTEVLGYDDEATANVLASLAIS